ncbi:hypothetical protein HU200_002855 [Digitaria exilis]|uniref:DUF1618 domain-containing protein n=1 Tax=Digitaria exilis TaxID=1010633 RepID=A0A835FUX9_9POAL|nr:hypothetical protein HU200_002855 [Digitaria exilis]
MSATWPWVILGRVPLVLPILGDDEAAAPFYGVHSALDARETYLVVARRFRTSGVQQGHAEAPLGQRIPVRRDRDGDGRLPVAYDVVSVGLVASYDGNYTVAELRVDRGGERARLFRFREGDEGWFEDELSSPLAAEDRAWVPDGVVAQKNTFWWFDLSWGLLSCDVVVDEPVLLFHKLPEDRALGKDWWPGIHTHRCVAVSRRELRYVEIVAEDGAGDKEAATVSMWTRLMANPGAGWEWEKKYAMSFEKLWNDNTYMYTGLPRKVPVLSAVCPSNPDLVYFALEQRLFGINVPVHKVVEIADEPHELVKTPWPAPASCRYVHAWNLPRRVASDLDLVGFSSSDEDEDQEEERDEEELLKLGLQAAMRMDPATLKSEVETFFNFEERPPSPEKKVVMQLRPRPPFNFWLTDKEADADLAEVDSRVMMKRRRDE